MHTGKLEQYKRLIRFGFNILLLAILIFFFIHIWDENYNDGIVFPFYYKGYLMMAAFYAFFLRFFLYFRRNEDRIFKSSSLMLSQTLALLASNVLIYLETVLLSAKFIPVEAMIVLTFIDVGVILVWTLVVNWIFRKLFPPRDILLLYEEYDPTSF